MKPGSNILKLKIMNVIDNRTFTTLINKTKNGDKVAKNKVFNFAEKELKRMIPIFTKDIEVQNDVVQTALIRAFQNFDKFDPKFKLEGWLYVILRNEYFKHYHRKQKEMQNLIFFEDLKDPILKDNSFDEYKEQEHKQESNLFQVVQDELSKSKPQGKEQREIIQMYFLEGLSEKEISEYKNVSLGTVKSQKNRGLKNIRKNIEAKL